jgi:hypothetical protein
VTSAATGRVLCEEWNRQPGRAPRDRKGDIALVRIRARSAVRRTIGFAQMRAKILVRRVPAPDEQEHCASLCRWLLHHLALQERPFALASLSQRNATSYADRRGSGCPSARAMSTLAAPIGPLSSTVSKAPAGCKQKSGSVGAVDETAARGAKQQPARHDCL